MAPATKSKAKGKKPAETKAKVKLNVKAPAKTEVTDPKTSDEVFLLTLLDPMKVDHQAAADTLGINKASCRMRFTRLQQKHGFKVKGKGTPRREKKGSTNANKKPVTEKKTAPANESDIAEGEADVEAAENRYA